MRDVDNPRLQCEHCGKWRRLITNNEQCMFYWAPEHDDFVGNRIYQNICVWCVDKIKQGILTPTHKDKGADNA